MKIRAESQTVTCGDTHMKRQTQTHTEKEGPMCTHTHTYSKANRHMPKICPPPRILDD